ncbi:MAG: hypothetical protein Q8O67_11830 [Deltaproteobacteria bacterium]|nr:hypothetical protein [Deltaproteobacteria bacterium]
MSGIFIEAAVLEDRISSWAGEGRIRIEARFRKIDGPVPVGETADVRGTLLKLSAQLSTPPTAMKGDAKDWASRWAAIFVAAGYLDPHIDPERLAALYATRARLEFILDTSALVSGVGHWLVRRFGERCDLVRTVVTDYEVQRFLDQGGAGAAATVGAAVNQGQFRMASVFLEHPPHAHPIWRNLDISEEGALFAAAQGGSKKSPALDVLLFRAARRAILDRVSNLDRLFVTGDGGLGRGASHDLPTDCVLVGFPPALEDGACLSAVSATATADGEYRVLRTGLAAFVLEALLFCDELQLHSESGRTMSLRGYVAGAHQFPSMWKRRGAWVSEQPTPPGSSPPTSPPTPAEPPNTTSAPSERTIPPSAVPAQWPLVDATAELLVVTPRDTGARVTAETLLESLTDVLKKVGRKKKVDVDTLKVEAVPLFVRLGVIDRDGRAGDAFDAAAAAVRSNDLDALWRLFGELRPYHELASTLIKSGPGSVGAMTSSIPDRQQVPALGMMRTLAQAVVDDGVIYFGGAAPTRLALELWLTATVERISRASALGQAPIAQVARAALVEQRLSPWRFSLALNAMLTGSNERLGILPERGGTPGNVLVERIARFTPDGSVEFENVSADGLLGYAALRRTR